ncbi:ATP-binding cassette domain-containing protein [Rhodobacteraceae bacterium D3-12]|nr:ATP-binding cassette domain-containing protein [Rhodobacteraceae bacterium D3-12]
MTQVVRIIRLLVSAAPWAMARGAALSVVVLLMGAALLGLSGWFITATGLAGIAGIGIAFDVFRPSAGVRFLALGRTAARYGERLLTHDAILRALAALRVTILGQHGRLDARALARLRGEAVLTRMVADVDALDGLILRIVLPAVAGFVTHAVVFAMLVWLVGPGVAIAIAALYLPTTIIVPWWLARATLDPSDRAEKGGQSLRRGMIDMIRDREALILSGTMDERETQLIRMDEAVRRDTRLLDRVERRAGLAIAVIVTLAAAGAFLVGGWILAEGSVGPAKAVIGLFVALALAETVLPLRRGFGELGRMIGAANRIDLAPAHAAQTGVAPALAAAPTLVVSLPDVSLSLAPGEAVALSGPSGAGKSTLLLAIAGLLPGDGIALDDKPPTAWEESTLRERVAVLPQRSALLAGTIRENLCLAAGHEDAVLWGVLKAVALGETIKERGGLDARLGEGGAGLSGGQARRLALARCLLSRPDLLLLDEPTEGLDPQTADMVLTGVRSFLPKASLLVALHRGADHPVFDRVCRFKRSG